MVVAFALIAGSTAAILMGITIFIFNTYFSSYTSQNMETIAQYTATRISDEYKKLPSLRALDYKALMERIQLYKETGLMVLDAESETVFSTEADEAVADGEFAKGPSSATKVAIAQITVGGEEIGSVRVWIYGSDALMNKADIQFRDNTINALVIAAILALFIAILLGILFSNWFVAPIKRITVTANELSEGNLSARTGMTGNNEIDQLGKQLDQMAESIERDRQMELRLTSDVAHELRTPLMAVQATVEAMIDGVYDTDTKHLSVVDSEVKRLSHLVDALLRLSRLEKRSKPMDEEITDLGELVETMVASHEVFVHDSGLGIASHVRGKVMTVCDKDLIRQAVANLISNAVRYTPEGGRIDVFAYNEMTPRGKMAVIDVKDTGIGLSEEEAKMVFARFWRADSGRHDKTGGLGIGLTVVKEIVDQHRGEIKVKGEPGKGSIFSILLPAYDEEASRREARDAIRAFERTQRTQRNRKRASRTSDDVVSD